MPDDRSGEYICVEQYLVLGASMDKHICLHTCIPGIARVAQNAPLYFSGFGSL